MFFLRMTFPDFGCRDFGLMFYFYLLSLLKKLSYIVFSQKS